jgi:hypothetical protein
MSTTVHYQGYSIQSTPKYHPDWQKWQIRIFIAMESAAGVRTRKFESDVLYATEQEANVHGIAYGQRVIDGKAEGQSVADMKGANRRATPRLRVQFRTTFSNVDRVEGIGAMLDLSAGGCRIESAVQVHSGETLELRIYVPDVEWPLMVDAATVQWVSDRMFGLAFFRMPEPERQRLEAVLEKLGASVSR